LVACPPWARICNSRRTSESSPDLRSFIDLGTCPFRNQWHQQQQQYYQPGMQVDRGTWLGAAPHHDGVLQIWRTS
jgi:hypothetical protein